MADNRMFLVHKPTGRAIMLGKRLGAGWYDPPDPEQMQRFFDSLACEEGWDDYILLLEDYEKSSSDSIDWDYVINEFTQVKINSD